MAIASSSAKCSAVPPGSKVRARPPLLGSEITTYMVSERVRLSMALTIAEEATLTENTSESNYAQDHDLRGPNWR